MNFSKFNSIKFFYQWNIKVINYKEKLCGFLSVSPSLVTIFSAEDWTSLHCTLHLPALAFFRGNVICRESAMSDPLRHILPFVDYNRQSFVGNLKHVILR